MWKFDHSVQRCSKIQPQMSVVFEQCITGRPGTRCGSSSTDSRCVAQTFLQIRQFLLWRYGSVIFGTHCFEINDLHTACCLQPIVPIDILMNKTDAVYTLEQLSTFFPISGTSRVTAEILHQRAYHPGLIFFVDIAVEGWYGSKPFQLQRIIALQFLSKVVKFVLKSRNLHDEASPSTGDFPDRITDSVLNFYLIQFPPLLTINLQVNRCKTVWWK